MKIPCSNCNQNLEIPEELAGQTIECPACKASLAVPAIEAPPPPASRVEMTTPQAAAPQKFAPKRKTEAQPKAASGKKLKSVIPKLAIAVTAVVLLVILGLRKPEPPKVLLYYCIQDGNVEAVKQHIKAGTDVNGKKGEGGVPLNNAVGRGHKEIVELLIAAGADVNLMDSRGDTPLHNIANVGQWKGSKFAIQIAELLIAEGANVNAKDNNNWTPLHNLAHQRQRMKEIAELLITKGADVNAKGANILRSAKTTVPDGTPLGVEILLDFETPLGAAIYNKKTELADLLRKHGGKTGEELKAEGK